ncbi:MAG: flagellar hook-basal body complex protein, partial [Armatimonadota bacterium]
MNRALLAGLSGTLSNQAYIDVLANNIANANTTGFREGRLGFTDAFYQTLNGGQAGVEAGLGGINPAQIGSGSRVGQIQVNQSQGSLSNTGNALDAAIEGPGMFVLGNAGDGRFFTRDGSFALDNNHVLVAGSSGLHVLGWTAQDGVVTTAGDPTEMQFPIGRVTPGRTTANVTMGGNLDAGLAADDARTATISVYDSVGTSHQLTLTFTKTAANEWSCHAASEGSSAHGTVTFDSADGSVASGGTLDFSLVTTNGSASPVTLQVDLGRVTQLTQAGSSVQA